MSKLYLVIEDTSMNHSTEREFPDVNTMNSKKVGRYTTIFGVFESKELARKMVTVLSVPNELGIPAANATIEEVPYILTDSDFMREVSCNKDLERLMSYVRLMFKRNIMIPLIYVEPIPVETNSVDNKTTEKSTLEDNPYYNLLIKTYLNNREVLNNSTRKWR